MQREAALLWLTDEDIQAMGVNPKQVSPELFEDIKGHMQEYLDESFAPALKSALDNYRACIK